MNKRKVNMGKIPVFTFLCKYDKIYAYKVLVFQKNNFY
jgi:hypothetical protein